MDTLAFGYILPTTGRIPDLHRLETCAAGRTQKEGSLYRAAFPVFAVLKRNISIRLLWSG
jgi:hypothetical protein